MLVLSVAMDSDYEISDTDDYDYMRCDGAEYDYMPCADDYDYVNMCLTNYASYNNRRKKFDRFQDEFKGDNSVSSGIVGSLLDLSAKVASQCYSYNYVESLYQHIPEPVAKKFMLWSFPRSRDDLVKHFGHSKEENVYDVVQIGFQVSGRCKTNGGSCDVSLYIDRCVITSASCSCTTNIMPCNHLLALAFYRLVHADTIPIHLPISDSLNPLNREQLLYLVKYIINKHSNILLPSAQAITNELLDKTSEKNSMPGAPDPTAGGDMDSDPVWLIKRMY